MIIECNKRQDLVLEMESEDDCLLMKLVIIDATMPAERLANRLGRLVDVPELRDDWEEFVVPDLDEAFERELRAVFRSVDRAIGREGTSSGKVVIRPRERRTWYAVLNQARLTLEEIYQFGHQTIEELDAQGIQEQPRAAFLRTDFYIMLQSMLLELGLDGSVRSAPD